jgi:DtxR family Mn-dependent transcriptional regulator
LKRIGEPAQIDPEFLGSLKAVGLVPGAKIDVEHSAKRLFISLVGSDDGLEIDHDLALHFFVKQ